MNARMLRAVTRYILLGAILILTTMECLSFVYLCLASVFTEHVPGEAQAFGAALAGVWIGMFLGSCALLLNLRFGEWGRGQ
jgi:hypothetical protein